MPLTLVRRALAAPTFVLPALLVLLAACSAERATAPGLEPTGPRLQTAVAAATGGVVISQVYGGGGNSGATYKNDFIELFNAGSTPVSLDGWSVQYASSAGTSWQVTALSGSIAPGTYYLVQQAAGTGGTTALPAPEAAGTLNMSGTTGKVALARSTLPLTGACPTGAEIVDLVGFGSASCFEGTPTAALSNTTAASRKNGGCTDTGNNLADFALGAPAPRNAATPTRTCEATPVPTVASVAVVPTAPTVAVGATLALTATAQDAAGQAITGTTFTWTAGDAAVALVNANGVVTGVAAGTVTVTATAPNGVAGAVNVTVGGEPSGPTATNVRVSELHYDNDGTDVDERIEIEGDVGGSLAGWSLVLYSGSTGSATAGQAYRTIALSGTLAACSPSGTRGVLAVDATGLQNGDRDGLALVNAAGEVVEFLSYEGAFTATNGPATGRTAVDVGVDEEPAPAAGRSLQRASDGSWFGPYTSSFGGCNPASPPPRQTGISFSGRLSSDPALPVGFADQVFASLRDANTSETVATTFSWTSETPTIAAVDARGVVTALAEGSAIIRATAANGVTATLTLPTEIATGADPAVYRDPLAFGTPSDATPGDELRVTRPQYALSYNRARNTPNWVAYHLSTTVRGNLPGYRCDCFTPDPQVTAGGGAAVSTADYTGSGFDRGHMVRSNDRELGHLDQATTYYTSNIVPQYGALNQGRWADLESYLQTVVDGAGRPEVYIFTGPRGAAGRIGNDLITVPTHTWKVAVVLPAGMRPDAVTKASDVLDLIAVDMPNVANLPRDGDWRAHRVSVDSVEKLTGYDVLSVLPNVLENVIESGDRAPTAAIAGATSGVEGATITFGSTGTSDPDVGGPLADVLSYQWSVNGEAVGIEPSLTRTFPQDTTYTVTLIVSDRFGAADTATTTVAIANVAPKLAPLSGAVLYAGEGYQAAGRFADPGADAWTATVAYEGGQAQPLTLADTTFALSHLYGRAGSYTLTVAVRDDDATGSATAAVEVRTPLQGVADLGKEVDGLLATRTASASSGGTPDRGEVNALRLKLDAAAQQLRGGNGVAAANILNAFVEQLGELVANGRLSRERAQPLVTLAQRVARSAAR